MQRIVDWRFLITTFLLSAVYVVALVDHVHGALAWVLFCLGVPVVYAAVYKACLQARVVLFPSYWDSRLRSRWQVAPRAEAGPGNVAEVPVVAFLLASYQEPFEVAKMTFDCARDSEYAGRREIIVVDNSNDRESEDFKSWKAYVESHIGKDPHVRVVWAYNEKKGGMKPGNIDLAQTLIAEAKYVVLLDVDSSLPLRGGLIGRSVADFETDEKLGILQFHTVATNDHFNALTGPVAVVQNALRILHLLRGDGGFAMFYGHNAMWRRALLDAQGPWLEHYRGQVMVTEDLLKSVGAYLRGYTVRYVDVASGEWIPSSLDALESMWMRWGYGGFQVLFKYARRILTSPNLAPLERFDLLTFMGSYLVGALAFPMSLLWILTLPPARVGVLTFVLTFLPPAITAMVVHRRYTSELSVSRAKKLWDLYAGVFVMDAFIVAVCLRAVINFLLGVKQGWKPTAKGLEARPTWPQVIARNLYVVGLAVTILVVLAAAWGSHTGFALAQLPSYLPQAFVAFNLILCIVLYGRQGRNPEARIEGTTIDGYQLRNEVLAKVPLFHGTGALFQHGLALSLTPRLRAAGEDIVRKGEPGHEMFFITRGEVEVLDGAHLLRTLRAGSYFGERSLLLEEPRSATVRARSDCDLLVLDKAAFLRALRDQPRVARTISAQAWGRYDLKEVKAKLSGRELDGDAMPVFEEKISLDGLDFDAMLELRERLSETLVRRFERPVALAFSDVVDSTAYFARFGNEAGGALMQRHIDLLRQAVADHGGRIVDTAGDGAFMRFASAESCVAALVAHERLILAQHASRPPEHHLRVRCGVHFGPVLTDGTVVTGDAVNLCARITAVAGAGEICLTRAAADQLSPSWRSRCEPLPAATLKGVPQPVEMVRLRWSDRRAEPTAVRVEESGEVHALPAQPTISFGRLREHAGTRANDVVLALTGDKAQKISRWHFELRRSDGALYLHSVSEQPTEVDGKVVEKGQSAEVTIGTVVRLAEAVTLTFLEKGDDAH